MAGHQVTSLGHFFVIIWITSFHTVDGRHHLACLAPPVPPPTLRLSCPESRIIHVTMARLGRSNYGVCVPTVRDCFRQVPTPTHCCGRQNCDVTIRSNITHFVTEICGAPAHYFQIIYDCKERDAIKCDPKTRSSSSKSSPNLPSKSPSRAIGRGAAWRVSPSLTGKDFDKKENLPDIGVKEWSFDFKPNNNGDRHRFTNSRSNQQVEHNPGRRSHEHATPAPVIPQLRESGVPSYPRLMTTERTTEPFMLWRSLVSGRGQNVPELMKRLDHGDRHSELPDFEQPVQAQPKETSNSERSHHPVLRHLRPLPPDLPGHPPWVSTQPPANINAHGNREDMEHTQPPPSKYDETSLNRDDSTPKYKEISRHMHNSISPDINETRRIHEYKAETRYMTPFHVRPNKQPEKSKTSQKPATINLAQSHNVPVLSMTPNPTPPRKLLPSAKDTSSHNVTLTQTEMPVQPSTTMPSPSRRMSSSSTQAFVATSSKANGMNTTGPENISIANKDYVTNTTDFIESQATSVEIVSDSLMTASTLGNSTLYPFRNLETADRDVDEYDRQAATQFARDQEVAKRKKMEQHEIKTTMAPFNRETIERDVDEYDRQATAQSMEDQQAAERELMELYELKTTMSSARNPTQTSSQKLLINTVPDEDSILDMVAVSGAYVKPGTTTSKPNEITQVLPGEGDSNAHENDPIAAYDSDYDDDSDQRNTPTESFSNNEAQGNSMSKSTASFMDYDVLDVTPAIRDDNYDFEQVPGGPIVDPRQEIEDYSVNSKETHKNNSYDSSDDDWTFSDVEFDTSIYEYDDPHEHSTSYRSDGMDTEVHVIVTSETDMGQFERSGTTPMRAKKEESEKITTNLQGAALLGVAVGEGIMFIILVVSLALYMKRRPLKRRGIAPSGSPLYPEYHMEEEDSRTGSTASLQRRPDPSGYNPKHQPRILQNRLNRSPPRPAPRRTYITNAVLARQPILDFARDNLIDADILEPDILNNVNNDNQIVPVKPTRKYFYEEACTAFNIPPRSCTSNPTEFKTFKNVVDELSQTITKCNSLEYNGATHQGAKLDIKPPESRPIPISGGHYSPNSSYAGVIETAAMDPRLREYAADELRRIDDQISFLFNGNPGVRKPRSTPPPDYMQAFE